MMNLLFVSIGVQVHLVASSFTDWQQQAMMIDPAPAHSLKGPALPFLIGQDNLNLDPLDEDLDHYM